MSVEVSFTYVFMIYSTVQNFGISKTLKKVSCSPRLDLFDQNYSKNSNKLLFKITILIYCNF